MVSVAAAIGLSIILLVNSAAAAVLTRFFRVRMRTTWGSAIYVGVVVPFVLLVSTFVLGAAGLGFNLGSPAAVVFVTILAPLATGVAFDFFWMPSPAEVDLPDQREGPPS